MVTKSVLSAARTPIRLVNGSAPFQGRVEIYHSGTWGTVASTSSYGAKTLCQQMGYNIRYVSLTNRFVFVFGSLSSDINNHDKDLLAL